VKKFDAVQLIFQPLLQQKGDSVWQPQREKGLAFAPTNIALCKYWGKRDEELNLPMTSSLSVALPEKGSMTHLSLHNKNEDVVVLNGEALSPDSQFVKRIKAYLDLFRQENTWHLLIDIQLNIPVAAGVASSACGFASLISALNDMFVWQLSMRDLSLLARLGSGSAARSLWTGFVEWHAGVQSDGMDSYAEPLKMEWSDLYMGILLVTREEKSISSREAMQRTIDSSVLYANWPRKVARDMVIFRQALQAKNFSLLAGTAESNALTMHATMLSCWPPICYFMPETIAAMQRVWQLRRDGLELYFTQDAGPNLKLIFTGKNKDKVVEAFPDLDVVKLFVE